MSTETGPSVGRTGFRQPESVTPGTGGSDLRSSGHATPAKGGTA